MKDSTPYIFKLLNPRQGYPEYDDWGALCGYLRVSEIRTGQLLAMYPDAISMVDADNLFHPVTVYDYWDSSMRYVWIADESAPIFKDKHGLDFIPIVAMSAEGSGLFSNVEDQVEPFLFTEYQSGMYKRRNEMLTARFTILRTLGFSPLWRWHHEDPAVERPKITRDGFASYFDEGSGRLNR